MTGDDAPRPASSEEPVASRGSLLREAGPWSLAALAVILFHRALFLGETLYYRDLTILYLPQRRLLAGSWLTGDWPPLWTPLLHGGMPFLADLSNSALYPSQLLYLVLAPMQALDLEIALHALFAALAAYALGRTLGFSQPASVVLGVVYAFCGFSLSRTNLLVVHLAWPYVALVLLFWHRWRQEGKARWFVLAAAAGALQVLSGGPEIVALTHVTTLLWMAVFPRPAGARPARDLGSWATLAATAALLAAVQLLPTIELVTGSPRGAGIDFAIWSGWSVPPQRLPELVVPGFFGRFDRMEPAWYWGAARLPEGRPYMLSLYLGASSSMLALLGLAAPGPIGRRGRVVLAAAAGASIVFSLGRYLPGIELLYDLAPPLRLFRYPVKALNLAVLPVALLAAQGASSLRSPGPSKWARRVLWTSVFSLAFPALLLSLSSSAGAGLLHRVFLVYHETLRSGLARGLLHAAGILLLLALVVELRRRGRDGSRAVHLTALVVAVDLVVAAAPVNFTAPEGLLGTEPESVESVREAVGIGRLYRAPDPTPRFQPPTDDRVWSMRLHMEFLSMFFASAWGVPVVGHHDVHGLAPRRAVLFFHALTEGLPWPQRLDLLAANGVTAMISGASPDETGLDPFEELIELEAQPSWLYRIPDAAAPAAWVPRWVSAPDERSTVQLLARGIDPHSEAVVEGGEGSGPTVCDGAARVAIRRRSRESWTVEVDADCPGLLVLSVGSYPGWKTEVDGTPVSSRPANLLSTAVPIPAGRHLVEHRFEPLSPRLGALVSLVTLLALLGWARVRRER